MRFVVVGRVEWRHPSVGGHPYRTCLKAVIKVLGFSGRRSESTMFAIAGQIRLIRKKKRKKYTAFATVSLEMV